jgi:hypothetical protein
MRIWNELMIREHPRGAALLVGRQIRYLVQSDHGWLGGLSFSSAALQLEARDKWIGWDPETRRANLHYVVNMSRFLIRSTVSCRNLASKLLAMAMDQLPKDFKTLYGYRPLLVESFVDTSHFEGTCYRAANFQCIGQTKGRGRQGRSTEKPETVKAIYVYPLEKNFRCQMVVSDGAGFNKLNTAVGSGPIEEKKTFCWIEGVHDCAQLKNQMPNTDVICVMDREADFFELFDEHRDNCSNVDLLVRAQHDRKITGEDKLFDTARQSPVQAQLRIKVPRQSARPKKSKQKVRPKRPARNAEVCLRFVPIQINPPWHHKRKEPISVWVIHVREEAPPVGTDPVEWFLLTTIDIKTCEDALNCVKWYCLRWRIEDWHRVLKSGCQVEQIGHKTADRLRRAIAIKLVIAWRIMLMTLLGRANDPPPGHQIMWQGYTKLQTMCEGFALRDG